MKSARLQGVAPTLVCTSLVDGIDARPDLRNAVLYMHGWHTTRHHVKPALVVANHGNGPALNVVVDFTLHTCEAPQLEPLVVATTMTPPPGAELQVVGEKLRWVRSRHKEPRLEPELSRIGRRLESVIACEESAEFYIPDDICNRLFLDQFLWQYRHPSETYLSTLDFLIRYDTTLERGLILEGAFQLTSEVLSHYDGDFLYQTNMRLLPDRVRHSRSRLLR